MPRPRTVSSPSPASSPDSSDLARVGVERAPWDAPSELDSSAGNTIAVEVSDEAGRSLPFVVGFLSDGAVLDHGVVDDHGRILLERPATPAARLVVIWRGCTLADVDGAALQTDEIQLKVDAGVDLTVLGTVEGVPASRDAWLELRWDGGEELPEVLRRLDAQNRVVSTPFDTRGTARIAALPANGSGILRYSKWLKDRDGRTAHLVPGGTRRVELDLVIGPAIHGRVVQRTGIAASQARIEYETTCSGGGSQGLFVCGESGRFWIPLNCGDLIRGSLQVSDEIGGVAFVETGSASAGSSLDLGDIVLGDAARAELLVHRPDGAPIEGARVFDDTFALLSVEPSDAEGRLVLERMFSEAQRVNVAALGYATRSVELRGSSVQRIELAPIHKLEFFVQDALGGPVAGARLRIAPTSSSPFGPRFQERGDPTQVTLGVERPLRTVTGEGAGQIEWIYRTDQDGRVRLVGLVPGEVLRVQVADSTGAAAGVERTVVVEAASPQHEVVVAHAVDRALLVEVVDLDGFPIEGASVRCGGDAGLLVRTDANGKAMLTGALPASVDLEISAATYIRRTVFDVALPISESNAPPLVVTLEEGRTIEVEVRTADGAAIEASWARVEVGGEPTGTTRKQGAGRFTLSGIASGPAMVIVSCGGRDFEAWVGQEDHVEVLVPEPGSLNLVLEPGGVPLPEGSDGMFLQIEDDASGSFQAVYVSRDHVGASLIVPVLFPGMYALQWQGAAEDSIRKVEVRSGEQATLRFH